MLGEVTLDLMQSLIQAYQDADRIAVCVPFAILISKIGLLSMQLGIIAIILMKCGQGGFGKVNYTNRRLTYLLVVFSFTPSAHE